MGQPPKNYVESVLPMITLCAIIGHEVFRYPSSKPRVLLSIFYTVVMLTTTAILIYFTFLHVFTFNYDTIEEKLFIFTSGMKITIVLSTGSLSWYYYNKRNCTMEKIMLIDETLTELGADCEHDKTYRSTIMFIAMNLILMIIFNSVDTMWIINKHTILEIFWIIVVTHHPYHVSNYVLTNCSIAIRGLAVRFRITNRILQEVMKQNGYRDDQGNISISRRNLQRIEQIRVASRENSLKNTVLIIKQVHLELCSVSEDLNTIYGVQIVLQLGAYFIFLTVLGYALYVIYVNPTFLDRTRRICALSFWFIVHFLKIIIINHISASVTYEAYKTQEIIQELNIINDDPNFKDELRQFSLQIMESPSFTPMGFFTLGYGLVSSMLGTVATYLVILIQTNIIPESTLTNNK